jgi:hypothetical protein
MTTISEKEDSGFRIRDSAFPIQASRAAGTDSKRIGPPRMDSAFPIQVWGGAGNIHTSLTRKRGMGHIGRSLDDRPDVRSRQTLSLACASGWCHCSARQPLVQIPQTADARASLLFDRNAGNARTQ